ncbi:hypothetical protein [[Mycoplasma] testudinis]|uniref:hypothetical protein n=1 Tax=[Mycoplasma] testudinis TaxID=33924 RepID=UPI000484E3F7|nr:hypothetical protein [[Mycoplasma] testudinis]
MKLISCNSADAPQLWRNYITTLDIGDTGKTQSESKNPLLNTGDGIIYRYDEQKSYQSNENSFVFNDFDLKVAWLSFISNELI